MVNRKVDRARRAKGGAVTRSKRWSLKILAAVVIACLLAGIELGYLVFSSHLYDVLGRFAPNPVPPPQDQVARRVPLTGRIIFSAEQNGQWDLFESTSEQSESQRLTSDGSSRAPAITRDGARLAFESHRDGNWEIYTLDSDAASVVRLTRVPAFDGRPSWSPSGDQIAFASNRQDDLDIWVMNADGSAPQDLTMDSPAVDDEPAWSPDGQWIAFTSQRTNNAQIWIVSPDGKITANVSQSKSNDQSPAWSPDGKQVAFVSDRDGQRAIYVAGFSTAGLKNTRRVTFSGWDEAPTWSSDGRVVAFVSPRPERQPIFLVSTEGGAPSALNADATYIHSLALADAKAHFQSIPETSVAAPLYEVPSLGTGKLIPLRDVYLAPSYGQLSDRVSSSFQSLRAKVKMSAGWDFLGVLSDMTRQLSGECGDGCDILSWHKAGRAVDTRMAVDSGGVPLLEIIREDQLSGTYWRIYLRTSKQDGSMGEPLTEPPWDWTYDARWKASSGQGGMKKAIPAGYYADFTELAREYGWNRISSYDWDDLSWKENISAMEFWHYQNTSGLTWYAALRELYSDQALSAAFDWNSLIRQKEDPYLLRMKDIPQPPNAWRWFLLFP